MQELLAQFKSHGYELSTIEADGAIHRFPYLKSKDAGWYICFQNNYVKGGGVYYVCTFGDHINRIEYQINTGKKLTKEDRQVEKAQMTDARKKAADEKVIRETEAHIKATKLWPTYTDAIVTEYMTRKQIDRHYGSRAYKRDGSATLVIPMVDVHGKMWGMQRILDEPWEGRDRFFMKGQRKKGLFHLIGSFSDEIFLCEGFATGVSIHRATGKSVVVAFDAGNMAEVAKEIRVKYPEIRVKICADNDCWKKDSKNPDANPGVDAANKAASMCSGAVIIPEFSEIESHPTDFNDLFVLEGVEKVRLQLIEQEITIRHGFRALGYDNERYYFFVNDARDIRIITAFTTAQMYGLAPKQYWQDAYPARNAGAQGGAIAWEQAKDELIQQCKTKGKFDLTTVRGTGVWSDDGRIVVNTGNRLIVDGKFCDSINSRWVYVQTTNLIPPLHGSPLTAVECRVIVDACASLKWRDPKSGYLLAGWIAIARLAGALPVRPHVWLTGGKNTGKTTVMTRIVDACLGNHGGKLYAQGGSTEAGIRQQIRSSSIPIIFDEFEVNDYGEEKVQSCIELMRQSWAQSGGVILKGSADGNSVQYSVSFAALVASIRCSLKTDADKSRFSVLELDELPAYPERAEHWRNLESLLDQLNPELAERLFSRSVRMASVILVNYKAFSRALGMITDTRFGQQCGMLFAGYWSLISDEAVTEEHAENLISELDLTVEKDEIGDSDELMCLNHLMTRIVKIQEDRNTHVMQFERTIQQIIESTNAAQWKELVKYGIRVESDCILIANQHTELQRLYARTRWVNWRQSLMRLNGATQTKLLSYMGVKSQGTRIPLPLPPR